MTIEITVGIRWCFRRKRLILSRLPYAGLGPACDTPVLKNAERPLSIASQRVPGAGFFQRSP